MQVSNSLYPKFYSVPQTVKNSHINTLSKGTLIFTGVNPVKAQKTFCINPINKFKDFSIAEYNNLSQNEIKFLRFLYMSCVKIFDRKFYNKAEIIHEKSASAIKNALDEQFGEGKYIFITIGRSLSSIGKVLGYKIGENNVKNIPMSCAHRFVLCDLNKNIVVHKGNYKFLSEYIGCADNVDVFRKYLEETGLSKNEILNSGKNYIVCDYSFSGMSMKGVKKLFEFEDLFGKQDNIHYTNVLDFIPINKFDFAIDLRKNLYNSEYKRFSFVENSLYLNETKSHKKITQNEKLSTKLFWFKLLDNEMNK